MTQHPSDVEMSYPQPDQPKKGWFGRNWLWFVPVVILLPILCCCGGGGALVWFGIQTITDLPPYKDSVAAVQQDADIQAELGSPISAPGVFEMLSSGGDMNANSVGSSIDFDATVPISGPNGSGTLRIEAESNDGGATWTYQVREFEIDATGEVIDLMPAGSTSPADNTPAPDTGREIPDQE